MIKIISIFKGWNMKQVNSYYENQNVDKRIGIANGQKLCSDDINQYDNEVASLFGVES